MGVDTSITLPAAVQVKDVAKAIGILLGKAKTWTDCSVNNNLVKGLKEPTASGWVEVEGVRVSPSGSSVECCTIEIEDIPARYGTGWWFLYHFEFGKGKKGMLGRSRAERICLHRKLVEIFGGVVDHNDSDDTDNDYARPARNLGSDDKAFHKRQLAIWNAKPMAISEIRRCEEWASYKSDRAPEPLEDVRDLITEAKAS